MSQVLYRDAALAAARKAMLSPIAGPLVVLGIEGTAHTFGVGIVRHEPGLPLAILADEKDMFRPVSGGIHPREAANHHADVAGDLVARALERAEISAADVNLVAFSQAPGLGPCLRTAATAARAFAIAAGKPLVGVNHCIAHVEIGRAMTPAEDPVLLYASGGNTQVIAFVAGKYRVFGETVDVGVGNMLDKFAREEGIPFPGGPEIEKLARKGSVLVDLPYTVKGMDVAFSGMLTAARAHVARGARLEDVCFALQETAFAMLTEVTERALAHTEKDEVVLGGGVACNERLFDMATRMCEARGARAFRPPKSVLVDNGVMIALAGAVQHRSDPRPLAIADSVVDQRQRTDDVAVHWRGSELRVFAGAVDGRYRGAEAEVARAEIAGRAAVRKTRVPKEYRHSDLDAALRGRRGRAEARLLVEARRAGVRTPLVWEVNAREGSLVLERLDGRQLKEVLVDEPGRAATLLADLGAVVARLHAADLAHGDLTTSNVIVAPDGSIVLIDFGLGHVTIEAEDKGTDLHVLMEALEATHAELDGAFERFLDGYRRAGGTKAVDDALADVVRRGRYRGT